MKNNQTKYLVLAHRVEAMPPTEAEFEDIAQVDNWFQQQHKAGHVETYGFFGIQRGGYGVWSLSMDELHQTLATAPFHPYCSYEIYPLVSNATFTKTIKEAKAQMAKRVPVGAHR